jgi:hypothetical protein
VAQVPERWKTERSSVRQVLSARRKAVGTLAVSHGEKQYVGLAKSEHYRLLIAVLSYTAEIVYLANTEVLKNN